VGGSSGRIEVIFRGVPGGYCIAALIITHWIGIETGIILSAPSRGIKYKTLWIPGTAMRWNIGTYVAHVLQALILLTAVYTLVTGTYTLALCGFIAIGLTRAPYLITRRLDIALPWEINLLIALSLHVAGGVGGRYGFFFPHYDMVADVTPGITIAVPGFVLLLLIYRFSHLHTTRMMSVYFIVLFTMGLGGVFEICEFVFDRLLGTSLQHGLNDTMLDLVFDFVGAITIALIGNHYLLKRSRKGIAGLHVGRPENGENSVNSKDECIH
jgi:hypothetical protein